MCFLTFTGSNGTEVFSFYSFIHHVAKLQIPHIFSNQKIPNKKELFLDSPEFISYSNEPKESVHYLSGLGILAI